MDGRITVIVERIRGRIEHPWVVDEMAAIVGISSSHLHKLFRENTSLSPMQYVRMLRLETAKKFLEDPRFYRVKEISGKVGFTDASNFSREFKKYFGKSPAKFRREYWSSYDRRKGRSGK